MKNIIFLLLSVFLTLSGCSEKEDQPTTPLTEEASTAQKDDALTTDPKKTEPTAAVAQEAQEAIPSKENSQPIKATAEEKGNAQETAAAIQKDSGPTVAGAPTKETIPSREPAKALEKPTASVHPASAPKSPTPPLTPPPTPDKETAVEEEKSETVRLFIKGDKEMGVILSSTQVKFEEGDTVLKVLARSMKEKNIPMEYRGTSGMAYIEGIANLYEFDRGPTSGWMFRVNGGFGSQSAGSVKLKPGDQVEWFYTLDLGKDIGAKP